MMSLSMTSCSDWLEVLPQTQIVEENFWEDKNDLDGVRYAVYKNMSQQVSNMIVWGDLRAADIYTLPSIYNEKEFKAYIDMKMGKISPLEYRRILGLD